MNEKLRSPLDELMTVEERDIRRSVELIERLMARAGKARDGSLEKAAAMAAFVSARGTVEREGYELELTAGGITWRKAPKKEDSCPANT